MSDGAKAFVPATPNKDLVERAAKSSIQASLSKEVNLGDITVFMESFISDEDKIGEHDPKATTHDFSIFDISPDTGDWCTDNLINKVICAYGAEKLSLPWRHAYDTAMANLSKLSDHVYSVLKKHHCQHDKYAVSVPLEDAIAVNRTLKSVAEAAHSGAVRQSEYVYYGRKSFKLGAQTRDLCGLFLFALDNPDCRAYEFVEVHGKTSWHHDYRLTKYAIVHESLPVNIEWRSAFRNYRSEQVTKLTTDKVAKLLDWAFAKQSLP